MDDDKEFENWLAQVDKELNKEWGFGHRDLPDWGWRDAFDDGLSPEEAAESYKDEMEGEW